MGPSGAGKSTAIDLILGLIDPDKGSLKIGDTAISPDNKRLWQGQIGFDEATSALDGITENAIMTAIHELTGKKTIILIAHRLKTVEQCDQIYLLHKGKIIDQGSYQELLHNNPMFKKMAAHA